MVHSRKKSTAIPPTEEGFARRRGARTTPANRLKDDVYREMFRLEVDRPGSEMGLALALLRAVIRFQSLPQESEFGEWLKMICPIGLRMIEEALQEHSICNTVQ